MNSKASLGESPSHRRQRPLVCTPVRSSENGPRRRLKPWFFLVGVALSALFAGCQSKDPLDWKVRAKTPAKFMTWFERTRPKMPRTLAEEFSRAVANLSAREPGPRVIKNEKQLYSDRNGLCLKVNNQTIRAVLIAGYHAANTTLLHGINRQSENLLRNLETLAEASGTDRERLERLITRQRADLEAAQEEITANERRCTELAPPAR